MLHAQNINWKRSFPLEVTVVELAYCWIPRKGSSTSASIHSKLYSSGSGKTEKANMIIQQVIISAHRILAAVSGTQKHNTNLLKYFQEVQWICWISAMCSSMNIFLRLCGREISLHQIPSLKGWKAGEGEKTLLI